MVSSASLSSNETINIYCQFLAHFDYTYIAQLRQEIVLQHSI